MDGHETLFPLVLVPQFPSELWWLVHFLFLLHTYEQPRNLYVHTNHLNDETLVKFIKTKHQAKGEREDNKKAPKSKTKTHKPKKGSQGGKRTNYVLEPPPITTNISKKEREGKLESIVSLKKPPLATTVHLKISR